MKRHKRDISPREQRILNGFIKEICHALRLPGNNAELYQCAWDALMPVIRSCPLSFSTPHSLGWKQAYQVIWDALEREKKYIDFCLYQCTSLDMPVSREIPISRIEFLQAPHGDFQNSVCFHDYLHHIGRDACRMAYDIIDGCTLDEIKSYYHWSSDHTFRTYNRLHTAMERYVRI